MLGKSCVILINCDTHCIVFNIHDTIIYITLLLGLVNNWGEPDQAPHECDCNAYVCVCLLAYLECPLTINSKERIQRFHEECTWQCALQLSREDNSERLVPDSTIDVIKTRSKHNSSWMHMHSTWVIYAMSLTSTWQGRLHVHRWQNIRWQGLLQVSAMHEQQARLLIHSRVSSLAQNMS